MWKKLLSIWNLPDLRNKILFVIAMLVIFRATAAIPLPGIDVANLKNFFQNNELFGLLNIFSGGGLERFSLVSMGVAPYITSSIILQLLVMIVPQLEALSKEGEYGRQKINQYTRYLTVPLAILQAYGLLALLRQSSQPILGALSILETVLMVLVLTAGTVFLMWIGELISEKKVGNGISLLIFAGIVSQLPSAVRSIEVLDASQIFNFIAFAVIGLITIVLVIVMTEGQRNVPVTYARRTRGMSMGSVDTHLPIRVSQAGVIPIIFAISVILFPPTIAQFFIRAKTQFIADAAQGVISFFNGQVAYGIMYFLLVIAFTYFYTSVIFKPDQISENLQKQGGFIPGIRPGKPTSDFLQNTVNKIILPGAVFLGLIAVLPLVVQSATGINSLAIGGTSLLIVVSVAVETFKQIEAQMTARDYEEFL
ncbi:MAG: preprotein translocase subunit SecY [Candidatus Uhrbacteria bacterium]|nr:preprotein translocase subunit SecY [Candidatus Uhrbacteria bacterium]